MTASCPDDDDLNIESRLLAADDPVALRKALG